MILVVTIAVVFLLIFVLSNKLFVMDRGVDKKETKEDVNISAHPYVPPEVDKQIDEKMKTLQKILIPVQYVDNGLMPKIENATSKIEKALKPDKYNGPSPFSSTKFSERNFKEANFKNELNNLKPHLLPKPSADDDNIEPFNSFLGMVVSEGQTIGSFDQED